MNRHQDPEWRRHQRAVQGRSLKKAQRRRQRKKGGAQPSRFDPALFAKPSLPNHRLVIERPERLGFVDYPEDTILFLMSIRRETQHGNYGEIIIDHTALVDLSAAAALALIAELFLAQY